MNSMQKEQILRVNCPGFGEQNYLTVGKARALDAYKVIIVNPVSIFHIFDKDLDLQKDIDSKLAEGLTSATIASDEPLQTILDDLKTKRILELVSFLEKGGLLVYYLCRPFLVQGDNLAIDNYAWLESLAPDSSPDDNIRHMSAVSHGRVVETTEQGEASEFAAYFGQPGLEWNTIIRQDFLTEGYVTLATAGPRKCISAQLIAGDQGGRILFLPAPYSPDFDKKLTECVQIWYDKYNPTATGPGVVAEAARQPAAVASTEAAANIHQLLRDEAPPQAAQASSSIPIQVAPTPAPKVAPPEPIKFAQPATSSTGAVSNAPASDKRIVTKSLFDSHSGMPAAQPAQPAVATTSGAAASSGDDSNGKTITSLLDSIVTAQPAPPSEPRTNLASILGAAAPAAEPAAPSPPPAPAAAAPAPPPPPPAPRGEAVSKPNANDLLRELESLSAAEAKAAPPPPPPPPPPAPARDLVAELETLAQTVRSDKPVQAEPPEPPEPPKAAPPPAAGKGLGTMFGGMNKKSMFGDDEDEEPATAATSSVSPPPAPPAMATAPSAPVTAPNPPGPAANAVGSGAEPAQTAGAKTETDNHKDQLDQVKPVPEAKDLIKKMEEISKTQSPDWCAAVPFPVVDDLKRKRNALVEAIQQAQVEITQIEGKITQLESLKIALLGAEGDDLMAACMRVFMKLGWTPKISEKDREELQLSGAEKPEMIARVVRSASQAKRADIAQLAESVITFWGEHEIEPKGLLVACTWANRPMSERVEPDYTEGLSEFAQKKNLCLMTTTQLLAIFRDLEMGKAASEDVRRRILETSGRLAGYSLDNSMAAV